jgi:hypothetical protein
MEPNMLTRKNCNPAPSLMHKGGGALVSGLAVLCVLLVVGVAHGGTAFVVSERLSGNVWRIEDDNGDGDALDIGERTLWAGGFTSAQGMTTDGRAVYVAEEGLPDGSNQVVRLRDANGDGDALDIGERSVWLDGLDDPSDVSFESSGAWYLSEVDEDQIWRLADTNQDGDVLDIGERSLFADEVSAPQFSLPQSGSLIVPSFIADQIHRRRDLNGDGDALDVGENMVIVTQSFGGLVGLLDDGAGGFFFSSMATNTVYRARDTNQDGDMLDVGEVLPYADPVYGLLNDPAGLAFANAGDFLLADALNSQVKLVRDLNGDGDALDIGEVTLFADVLAQPQDITALPVGRPSDFNLDSQVDAADYVVWQKLGGSAAEYESWKTNFGVSAGSLVIGSSSVPEPDGAVLTLVIMALAFARRPMVSSVACQEGRSL